MNDRGKKPDLTLVQGPAGSNGQWLPAAVGFGTSMLPLFRSWEEIWMQPVRPAQIRPGDVITVRGSSRKLFTHRVVKISHRERKLVFLTKGDHNLSFDPWIDSNQVVGRVSRVGKRDLSTVGWRCWNRAIAFRSYLQGWLYYRLSGSALNQIRHRWEKKGWIPKARLRGAYRVLTFR